ncbi:thioredoxin family protein [Pirellulaceae bacterium]|nr:thioredoxin family protein [Pirellulaceae bacterium]MDB4794252.1 thioredoxin family protein [Pirellulaceae bacterium]
MVSELRREGYRIVTKNIRNHVKLAAKYNVRAVPTFVYEIQGKEVRRKSGGLSKTQIQNLWGPTWW